MNNMGSWVERAPCRDHDYLDPDAWHELADGLPVNNGVLALAVCRQCPVAGECEKWMARGKPRDTIAGGGWWDSRGKFKTGDDRGLMDSHQAAAYVGTQVSMIKGLAELGIISVKRRHSGDNYFAIEEVVRAQKACPVDHGTVEALHGHLIRNEKPCDLCEKLRIPV